MADEVGLRGLMRDCRVRDGLDLVLLTDIDGVVVSVDSETGRFLGRDTESMIGREVDELVHQGGGFAQPLGETGSAPAAFGRFENASGEWVDVELEMVSLEGSDPESGAASIVVLRSAPNGAARSVAGSARDAQARMLLEMSPDALVATDESGIIIEFNAAGERMFGWTADEIIGQPVEVLLPTRLRAHHVDLHRGFASEHTATRFMAADRSSVVGEHRDGSPIAVEISIWRTVNDGCVRLTAIIRDISKRVDNQDKLALMMRVFEAHSDAIVICDAAGTVEWANASSVVQLGLTGTPGENAFDAFDRDVASMFREIVLPIAFKMGWWSGEIQFDRDGAPLSCQVAVQVHTDGQGVIEHLSITATDVSHLKSIEHLLRHQANHDSLTGLPNREHLRHRLGAALQEGAVVDSLCVLFVDLDGFKKVNDTLGHDAGDAVLVEVARRLLGVVRGVDFVARLGGDEFVIVCHGADQRVAGVVGERIISAVREPFELGDESVQIGASVGLTSANPDSEVDSILREADHAVYESKSSGRSRLTVHQP